MDKLVEILREILSLLPFRTEAHAQELHEKVTSLTDNGGAETGGNSADAAPVGRNTTAPGVVTGNVPATDDATETTQEN